MKPLLYVSSCAAQHGKSKLKIKVAARSSIHAERTQACVQKDGACAEVYSEFCFPATVKIAEALHDGSLAHEPPRCRPKVAAEVAASLHACEIFSSQQGGIA